MMETRVTLEAARNASYESQLALHKLYEADTSNRLVWEAFQAQVEKTHKLDAAIIANIVQAWA